MAHQMISITLHVQAQQSDIDVESAVLIAVICRSQWLFYNRREQQSLLWFRNGLAIAIGLSGFSRSLTFRKKSFNSLFQRLFFVILRAGQVTKSCSANALDCQWLRRVAIGIALPVAKAAAAAECPIHGPEAAGNQMYISHFSSFALIQICMQKELSDKQRVNRFVQLKMRVPTFLFGVLDVGRDIWAS